MSSDTILLIYTGERRKPFTTDAQASGEQYYVEPGEELTVADEDAAGLLALGVFSSRESATNAAFGGENIERKAAAPSVRKQSKSTDED